MLKWTFETFGSDDDDINGKYVYTNTMTEGKGVFMLQNLYRAATGQKLESEGFDTEELVGKEVVLTLVESYDEQGNKRAWPEVKSFGKYV